MYYDELKTFITLAEVKNFTKTAEILHLSQPSVSLHIKNLEKEFQTKLFIRSPKRLRMTPTASCCTTAPNKWWRSMNKQSKTFWSTIIR